MGKSREHEPAARARAHRVGRVAPCLAQPLAHAPSAAAEDACRETRGRAHAHLTPQRRRASRRRPVATGRRSQACTSEGRHLARLPVMCSRRQACGSGRTSRCARARTARRARARSSRSLRRVQAQRTLLRFKADAPSVNKTTLDLEITTAQITTAHKYFEKYMHISVELPCARGPRPRDSAAASPASRLHSCTPQPPCTPLHV